MESIQKQVETKLGRIKSGQILSAKDFRGLGSEDSVKMALSRMASAGKVKRLAHGIYAKPQLHPLLGEIYPTPSDIAEAIARKEKVRIKPAGAYALNRLGLSTQVPTRFIYLTDGARRKIQVGSTQIIFKPVKPKKFAMKGEISSLVIQALEELNPANLGEETTGRIKSLLLKEDAGKLHHDLKLATARVSDFIVQLIKDTPHDRMAQANRSGKKA